MKSAHTVFDYFMDYYIRGGVQVSSMLVLPILSSVYIISRKFGQGLSILQLKNTRAKLLCS